ncbi:hypothetical protein N9M66_03990 [Litoreibacter sp.]|nr:hypothetical protein [Litoreibacter sp.]
MGVDYFNLGANGATWKFLRRRNLIFLDKKIASGGSIFGTMKGAQALRPKAHDITGQSGSLSNETTPYS